MQSVYRLAALWFPMVLWDMLVESVERERAEELGHPGVGPNDLAYLGVEVCSHGRGGHGGCGTEDGSVEARVDLKFGRVLGRSSERGDMMVIHVEDGQFHGRVILVVRLLRVSWSYVSM